MTSAQQVVLDTLLQIIQDNEGIVPLIENVGICDHVLIEDHASIAESWWPIKHSYWLIDKKSGERIFLSRREDICPGSFYYTPSGRWLLYYNNKKRDYFSYDLILRSTRNITNSARTRWTDVNYDRSAPAPPIGIAGWLDKVKALMIYDNYDIWQVDPGGHRLPINLTQGYGRQHHVRLRIAAKVQDTLILTAFNTLTKNMGFFRIVLGPERYVEQLSMGPWLISEIISAGQAGVWLVKRESCEEAPNYFITKDFKTFKPVTDIQPQKSWNWMSRELLQWKEPGGKNLQGILYKPGDFDPGKRYPIIFLLYEQQSDRLNEFQQPYTSSGEMNIAWMVSRGYLVCAPDIHYVIGKPGKSALGSVISAVRYLQRFPWIDINRMGLQGHSFGGWEVNYIITNSHRFAAACSASARSDLVSSYNNLYGRRSAQEMGETGQWRIGTTLWQKPKAYIANSPVMQADKITTPLLMMHNPADEAVPFSQAVEFFIALRRLGKPVWLLQYEKGGHLLGGREAKDFTERMTQFFDHYLKGAPAPAWMQPYPP